MKIGFVLGVALCLLPASVRAGQAVAASPQGPGGVPVGDASVRQRPAISALRMTDDERITMDGHLDDPAWARAIPASDFIQQDPDNGFPATEQTQVRILYNHRALYIGVMCFDSEPDKLL